ncbi:MAG: CHAT domain-containing protein [bacterium]
MAAITYLNFDLQIESAEERYRAHVLSSPAGEAEAQFVPPFSASELEQFFAEAGRARKGRNGAETKLRATVKDFGHRLFDAVFTGEILACYRRSFDQAQDKGMGLRLRLRLKNVPELASLPWEYLYNAAHNRALVLSKKTPVVRYLDLPDPPPPLKVKLPINVLVMISSPWDHSPLDVDQEWHNLKAAIHKLESKGLVRVERLETATLSMLQKKLQEHEFHIFHFIGHGNFNQNTQEGVLIFEDEEGKGCAENGQQVGTILHDHSTLRLAVFNACMTAQCSAIDPFTGLAQSLIQQGLPAVIAMLFPVQDETAATFTDNFYHFLTDGYPVEAALAETRKAILAKGNATEWGTPVLFMRSPDGQLFDFPASSPQPDDRALPDARLRPIEPIALEIASVQPTGKSLVKTVGIVLLAVSALLLLMFLSLGWPAVKKIVLPKNLPEQKHLVVLPFDNVTNNPTNQAFCDGLMETLTSRLTQLEQFSERTLWVVPASEVRNTRIVTIEAARRNFGVNLAITGSLRRDQHQVHMTMNLVDAKSLRQIKAVSISLQTIDLSSIPDELVIKSAEMLDMQLQAQQQRLLKAGGTTVSAAYDSYLEARGYMLSSHAQEQNLDAALTAFQRALAQDSLYALACAGLGEACWRKYQKTADRQWIEKAVNNCKRALALNEGLAPAHIILGEIYNGTGQYELALEESRRALAIDSVQAEGHRLQARASEN